MIENLPGNSLHRISSTVDILISRIFEYFSSLLAPPMPYQGKFPLANCITIYAIDSKSSLRLSAIVKN